MKQILLFLLTGILWVLFVGCSDDSSHYDSFEKLQKKSIEQDKMDAQQGNSDAQAKLAESYFLDMPGLTGVPQDHKEAAKWAIKAAEQGNAKGQSILGMLYYQGSGVLQDYAEAAKWLMKAAEQGDAAGQLLLGLMYYRGHGGPPDAKEADKWLMKAAEQGVPMPTNKNFNVFRDTITNQDKLESMIALGLMFYDGDGGPKDSKQAAKWLMKAAVQGEANAQAKLSMMYYNGEGVIQDYVEAYAWALHAYLNENPEAKNSLTKRLTPNQIAQGQVRAKELQKEMKEAR
jgi:uncharacterized protein